jgi:hypothetical protein
MATTPVTQLYDKTIYANKNTPVFRSGNFKKPFKTYKKGELIGVVYSHITRPEGLYLAFLEPKALGGRTYYMLYTPTSVDTTSLKQQGVKTDEQIAKEEADKNLYEKSKFEYFISKYGIWVLVTILAIPVVKTYVEKKL